MIIFIRNIGEGITKDNLPDLVEGIITSRIPFMSGKIDDVRILSLMDLRSKNPEYHGLVTINSARCAKLLIKKLRCFNFNNRYITAREYKHRTYHNDKRRGCELYSFDENQEAGNRKGDRRRGSYLKRIPNISAQFSSSLVDSKKHW